MLDHFAHRRGFGAAVEAVRAVDLADRVEWDSLQPTRSGTARALIHLGRGRSDLNIWSTPQVLTHQRGASAGASVAGTELRWSPMTVPRDAALRVVDRPNEPPETRRRSRSRETRRSLPDAPGGHRDDGDLPES